MPRFVTQPQETVFGQFLEISLHSTDLVRSIAFYEELGFTQLSVGEIWSHPYAVLSDGRLHIGLHGYAFDSPALTFVRPHLSDEVDDLKARGIRFAFLKTGDDEFNELGFHDPGGQMVTLLEARTYSPPGFGTCCASRLGRFDHFALPAPDVAESAGFWQRLGLKETDVYPGVEDSELQTVLEGDTGSHELPLSEAGLAGEDFAVTLHARPPAPRLAAVFADDDIEERIASLSAAGFELAPLPSGAALTTPEHLPLILRGRTNE